MGKHNSEIRRIKRRMEQYIRHKKRYTENEISFSEEDAIVIAKVLRINFDNEKFDLNEFFMGINIELEHGTRYEETNITNNEPIMTGKIAYAHLKEYPDYYQRLKKLEDDAEEYWGINSAEKY